MLVPLHNRRGEVVAEARVDPETFDLFSQWRWCLSAHGYATRGVRIDSKSQTIWMHRFILGLGVFDRRQGDHINGDRLDNRRANLRVVTMSEQRQNRRLNKNSTSGARGVGRTKGGKKWTAHAQVNGKRFYLGTYERWENAAAVAAAFRTEHMPLSRI